MKRSRSLVVTVAFGTSLALVLAALSVSGCKGKKDEDDTSPGVMEAAKRPVSKNNLKQLAMAMQFYENDNGRFPPAAHPAMDGTPGLSWRVQLLPYLEQNNLYNQFRLSEPWDSPNNKKLVDQIPKIYQSMTVQPKEPGMTYYQVFTGPGTIFETPRKLAPGQSPSAMRMTGIADGPSHTILIIEAAQPVIWTKPEDIVYDEKQPLLPKLGGLFSDRIHAALADASPVAIEKTADEKALRLAITCRDAQVFDADRLFGRGGIMGR